MARTRHFWIARLLPLIGVGVIALAVIPGDLTAGAKLLTPAPTSSTVKGFKSVPRVTPAAPPSIATPLVTKVSLTTAVPANNGVAIPWVDWSSLPARQGSSPAPAPVLTPGRVGYSGVNVRSGPSGTAAKLFVLPAGASIETAETTNGWVHIYSGGTDGWIYSTYLLGKSASASTTTATPRPQRATNLGQVVRITAPTSLRDAPGGTPVYDLQPGERVKIAESDGNWIRVLTVSGDTGWVRAR